MSLKWNLLSGSQVQYVGLGLQPKYLRIWALCKFHALNLCSVLRLAIILWIIFISQSSPEASKYSMQLLVIGDTCLPTRPVSCCWAVHWTHFLVCCGKVGGSVLFLNSLYVREWEGKGGHRVMGRKLLKIASFDILLVEAFSGSERYNLMTDVLSSPCSLPTSTYIPSH